MKNIVFLIGLISLLSLSAFAESNSFPNNSFYQEVRHTSGRRILVEEGKMLLVSLWLAQEKDFGFKPVSTIWGVGGPALMLSPLYADKSIVTTPPFAIPAGLGLIALSYYNFTDAPDQEKEEVFITNFVGQNLVLGACRTLKIWISKSAPFYSK